MNRKCQFLNEVGNQCKNKAIKKIEYFGESEIYCEDLSKWVMIYSCKKHIPYVEKSKKN